MNKKFLVTLAVIVGLLALWLLGSILYPNVEDTNAPNENLIEDVTDSPKTVEPSTESSNNVGASVRIVGDASELEAEPVEAIDANVTISNNN